MNQQEPHFLNVGQGLHARSIAYRFDKGASDTSPAIVWLSGFLSDMASTKVLFLSEWASENGYAMLRFDYSGHGLSGGDIEKASIGTWLEEAAAMLDLVSERPIILVGSSLGGWISLLLARALAQKDDTRLKGLVLVAPAWDMTEKLRAKVDYWKARARMLKATGTFLKEEEISQDQMSRIGRG